MIENLLDEPYWNELPRILLNYMRALDIDFFYTESNYYKNYFQLTFPKVLIMQIIEYNSLLSSDSEMMCDFINKGKNWQEYLSRENNCTAVPLSEVTAACQERLLELKRVLILNIMRVSAGTSDYKTIPTHLSDLELSFFKRLNSINNLHVLWEMLHD